MVNFVPAGAFHLCLNMPAVFSQPGNGLRVQPCILHIIDLINQRELQFTKCHIPHGRHLAMYCLLSFAHYRAIVRLAFPQWNVMTALNDLGIANCVCRCGCAACGRASRGEGTGRTLSNRRFRRGSANGALSGVRGRSEFGGSSTAVLL